VVIFSTLRWGQGGSWHGDWNSREEEERRLGEKAAERKVWQRRFFMSRLPFAKALRVKSREPQG
jgi:hypothetical protein